MKFSTFFSEQARKPSGWFGRFLMSAVFNIGNAPLNRLVYEMLPIQTNDRIIEIGCGTGKLIHQIANQHDLAEATGIDFSETMVSIAIKRNRAHIRNGKLRIIQADFNDIPLNNGTYNLVYSVNTVYFWENPDFTLNKIFELLKPKGKLVIGFEDAEQLKKRKLSDNIFNLYTQTEFKNLLLKAGFDSEIEIRSHKSGSSVLNCVVATK